MRFILIVPSLLILGCSCHKQVEQPQEVSPTVISEDIQSKISIVGEAGLAGFVALEASSLITLANRFEAIQQVDPNWVELGDQGRRSLIRQMREIVTKMKLEIEILARQGNIDASDPQ